MDDHNKQTQQNVGTNASWNCQGHHLHINHRSSAPHFAEPLSAATKRGVAPSLSWASTWQESKTAQRRPLGPDTDSSPQSCPVRATTLRVSAHGPFHLSLSLRPFLAPYACSVSALLQFSSELQPSESATSLQNP
jgi:hypothetical protein